MLFSKLRFPFYLSIAVLFYAVLFAAPVFAEGETRKEPSIRVAIVTDVCSVKISSTGAVSLIRLDTGKTLASYNKPQSFSFDLVGDQVKLSGAGTKSSDGFSIVVADDSVRLQVNGRNYRKNIRLVIWHGSMICVNVLPFEQYLWGVVPCEVPDTWPKDVLKAQAVAARTYAYRALQQYPGRPFDVYSTTSDQVYHGSTDEAESTTSACNETIGEICTWNGKPIAAYYHNASGGWTAASEEAFGEELPYLHPVQSRDASMYRWIYKIPAKDLASKLKSSGHKVGNIQRAWVHKFTPEGRVDEVEFVHTDGVLFLNGNELRKILGASKIQSTYFTVEGQACPDVQSGDVKVETKPSEQDDGAVLDDSLHPTTLVARKEKCSVSDCQIISNSGLDDLEIVVVLGADGRWQCLRTNIWVAEPARAGDLVSAGNDKCSSIFDIGESSQSPSQKSTLVDDPGEGIGAPSDGEFVFVGQGSGHGVGMSQHGAKALAEAGWSYTKILKYFYSGIEIEQYW